MCNSLGFEVQKQKKRGSGNNRVYRNLKQPIMRTTTEDRLFDRGRVRSAMATRKCGNIYFPKYFMAVRPFFTRIFFQELLGLEGSKKFLENFVRFRCVQIFL